jgi:hypothetical protein
MRFSPVAVNGVFQNVKRFSGKETLRRRGISDPLI